MMHEQIQPESLQPPSGAISGVPPRAAQPHETVAAAVAAVHGVAAMAPSFRQVLTSAARKVLKQSHGSVYGVDIVERAGQLSVYVDIYLSGAVPSSHVADDVDAAVRAALGALSNPAAADATVEIRVVGFRAAA